MSRVVVCGAGVIGLASAMLLARDGHDVTVLEGDHEPPPSEAPRAWGVWKRRGVPQFRQPHNLFPRFQHILDAELPEVTERLVEAGCPWVDPLATPPPGIEDRTWRPGDDRFRFLTGRRPVVEATFAAAAAAEPGVEVRRGAQVAGLLVSDAGPPVQVTGVRTSDGQEHRADLVVDAMGRASPVVGWLSALGARSHLESQDRGFAYYTRYYRGALPAALAPPLSPLGSISLLTIRGDSDSWSVTIFGTSHDRALKQARDPSRFNAVLRACPRHAHWTDGEALTDVLPMAGILDRYRRFVVDGVPVMTGLVAVGDAWACTNPSAGRGLSVGMLHAQLLRDTLRVHGMAGPDLALAWDAETDRHVTPYFRFQAGQDQRRISEVEAIRDGREPPQPDPVTTRLETGAGKDADLFRGLLELRMCLALPDEVLARPGVLDKAERLGNDVPRPLPGPSRRELVALLTE